MIYIFSKAGTGNISYDFQELQEFGNLTLQNVLGNKLEVSSILSI